MYLVGGWSPLVVLATGREVPAETPACARASSRSKEKRGSSGSAMAEITIAEESCESAAEWMLP